MNLIDKISAYKDILEDYLLENRSIGSYISQISLTRPNDLVFIKYILVNYFSNCKQVDIIVEKINEGEYGAVIKKNSLYKIHRKHKKRKKVKYSSTCNYLYKF